MSFNVQTFTFIFNPITTGLPLPYELIPGHQLRRATEEEAENIKKTTFSGGLREMGIYVYGESSPSGSRHSLRDGTWKLFGVASRTNEDIQHLTLAGNLLKNDLILGPSFIWFPGKDGKTSQGFVGNALKIALLGGDPLLSINEVNIGAEDVKEWCEVYQKLRQLPNDALRPYHDFETMRTIPPSSPLFALGLFGILESIVTHNPHDEFDSLTHQVSTKMTLLSKRFSRELPYKDFDCEPKTLWKRLYKYRSCVAHGSHADFSRGELRVLESSDRAYRFLMEALKLLLLDLLVEPDLIADLKEC
jgi:hypothetical protein